MDKRGAALILVTVLLVVLTIFGTALISSSFSENGFAIRYLESTQAFWLAEAGLSQALTGLRADDTLAYISETPLGRGGYNATIQDIGNDSYIVNAYGFIPFNAPRVQRGIQAVMIKLTIPNKFYETVIWSESNININGAGKGNYASVTGDVVSGGNIYTTPEQVPIQNIITGNTSVNDSTASSLPRLDFDQLKYISQNQYNSTTLKNNYYDAQRLSHNPTFPGTFWYNETAKIPNVVFIEGDLALSGNINVGGFFVVGGGTVYSTTVNGNVGIDGCLYTPGDINVWGGGSNLNVKGGVWAGSVSLKGSMTLSYNQTYMQGIKGSGFNTIMQVKSWRELHNPYNLD